MASELRTSISHPLQIATLPAGSAGGAIGITLAPGKRQATGLSGNWARDLDIDLQAIVDWGATRVISLLEPAEFRALGIEALPARVHALGLQWHGLPISDGAAPDARLLHQWACLGPALESGLHSGERLLVHCRGGLGRAGTVAAMLLLQVGACSNGEDAVAMVRKVRPGAVETRAQEAFIHSWAGLQR